MRRRGDLSKRMPAGNVSKALSRNRREVVEIVDDSPEESAVIQKRRSAVKGKISGAGPCSAPNPSKKNGISPSPD